MYLNLYPRVSIVITLLCSFGTFDSSTQMSTPDRLIPENAFQIMIGGEVSNRHFNSTHPIFFSFRFFSFLNFSPLFCFVLISYSHIVFALLLFSSLPLYSITSPPPLFSSLLCSSPLFLFSPLLHSLAILFTSLSRIISSLLYSTLLLE